MTKHNKVGELYLILRLTLTVVHYVLAKEKRHRSIEKGSGIRPMYMWTVDFQQRPQGSSMEKGQFLSTNGARTVAEV